MDKSDPVLHKAAEAPPGWKPVLSEAAQHIWNTSSAIPLIKPPFPLEGLENDDATPWKSITWCTSTKRDWRLNWKATKEKSKRVCNEVKRILDTHIYLCDGSERPRTYHWPFLSNRQLNSLSIQCLQVLWRQLRTAKRKDQLHGGCTSHICQD